MDRKAVDRSVYIHGTKYPNRIFVGGLGKTVDAKSLAEFFEKLGVVTEAKIIKNNRGFSKGYGFVSFATKTEAESVLNEPPIYYRGKKLNIGPAIRKQTPEIAGEEVVVVSKKATDNNNNKSNDYNIESAIPNPGPVVPFCHYAPAVHLTPPPPVQYANTPSGQPITYYYPYY